jgi:hypothetical protein
MAFKSNRLLSPIYFLSTVLHSDINRQLLSSVQQVPWSLVDFRTEISSTTRSQVLQRNTITSYRLLARLFFSKRIFTALGMHPGFMYLGALLALEALAHLERAPVPLLVLEPLYKRSVDDGDSTNLPSLDLKHYESFLYGSSQCMFSHAYGSGWKE